MIKLDDISKHYNNVHALKNISLSFNPNEITVIIGPSGGGKTTLLRCINFLESPSSGNIYIKEEKITNKNRTRLCSKIGMVFQNFNLFPHMSVKDNLIYSPVKVHKISYQDAITKAETLLAKFNLPNKLDYKIADLSGGQKQRVAIIRALMLDPEIILFDEPTSALDPEIIKDVIETINSLKASMTPIIITHHIKFAKAIADRILFMDQGHILANQLKDDFFEKPESHRARLFLSNIGDLV